MVKKKTGKTTKKVSNKSLDNTYKNYVARSNNFSNPEFYAKLKFRDKINSLYEQE